MLVTCSECQSQISDKAVSCPKCGAPGPSTRKSSSSGVLGFIRRYLSWIIVTLLLLFVIAGKPGQASFEKMLNQHILLQLSKQEITQEDNLVTGLIKLGCTLSQAECARIIREQMTVEFKDLIFATRAIITNKEGEHHCLGALGNWWCKKAQKQ